MFFFNASSKAGYLAIAPNALAPLGGTPTNEDEARTKFQELKQEDSQQNFIKVAGKFPIKPFTTN